MGKSLMGYLTSDGNPLRNLVCFENNMDNTDTFSKTHEKAPAKHTFLDAWFGLIIEGIAIYTFYFTFRMVRNFGKSRTKNS